MPPFTAEHFGQVKIVSQYSPELNPEDSGKYIGDFGIAGH